MPAKKKSQTEKALKGTIRPDREKGKEPDYDIVSEMPDVPETLNEYGAAFWQDVGGELVAKRILTPVDLPAFEVCCIHFSAIKEAALSLKENGQLVPGDRGEVKNPAAQILRDNTIQFRQYCGMFGIDPVSRAKVVSIEKPKEKKGIMGIVKKTG